MKKSKTLLWHVLLSFSLLFSTSNTNAQILIEQEAEIDFTYSGPGNASIKPRSMASNEKTVYITAQGAQLSWTIDLPASGEYFLNFRYSNDNFNGSPLDSISILVDGQFVAGTLCADTGDGGFGWNVFETTSTFSLGMLADQSVTISLVLSANYTGVEIDYLELTSDALLPVPPAPQLLTPADGATDVATNPTLTWAASTGADSYRVVVATDAGFSNVIVDETTGTTSWMLSGLTQGNGYFWRVRGTNATGNGPWSAAFSFLVSNPGADVLFFLDDAVGSPGTTVQILLQIDPSSNAICSFGLDLLYDPNVLSFTGYIEGPILPANWFLNANDNSGALNLSGFSQDLSSISTAGNLLVLNFTILPGTPASMTAITFSGGDSGNCQGFDLNVNTSDEGTVEIIPFGNISGQILYFDATGGSPTAGVPDLTVYLAEQGSGTILDSVLTDSQGNYAFANVPLGTDLEIRPKSDAAPQLVEDAMTVTDAFLGFSCVTGSLPFTSIFQQKIADANNSCTLNSVDAFVLFNLAVGSIADLSVYGLPDWCFVPQSYSLNDDNWCNAPASILLDALSGDATDQDFVAGIYGDVNGSAYPMLWGPPQDRFNESLGEGAGDTVYFIAPELVLENPETVSATVLLEVGESAVSAFEIRLHFDASLLALANFEMGDLIPDNWHTTVIEEANAILFAGFSTGGAALDATGELLNLEFTIPADACDSTLALNLEDAVAGNTQGQDLPTAVTNGSLDIICNQTFEISDTVPDWKLFPNPANTSGTLAFSLSSSAMVQASLWDAQGQKHLDLFQQTCRAGVHQYEMDLSSLTAGTYFVILEVAGQSRSIRPIAIIR